MPPKKDPESSKDEPKDKKIAALEKRIKALEEAKMPKEKKPRKAGPYAIYIKANFKKIKELPENEGKSAPEIMKIIAKMWTEQKNNSSE